ncbi:MAG: 4-alpha-glucanotransferase, partial [Anaerolineales bacterium]|nr:4-alpha-glucanotransferase [Anaerolineales bacterium]
MLFTRSAGVLVHPTSFPGRYGIGDLGDAAYHFIDFLVSSKQSLWQILPLGPTGYGDSPYQSFSAFAGNPMLINPDHLARDGYLPSEVLHEVPNFPKHKVDYGWVIQYKTDLLKKAYLHFAGSGTLAQREAFDQFCAEQAYWLDDFALFMAIKDHHVDHEGGVWNTWPQDIAQREPAAMQAWAEKLADDVQRLKFWQFLFFNQWFALKKYANDRGIKVVGDIPIFVAFDSADVWGNQELFYLDETGAPTVIAGVPPDYFSETGQ